MKRPKKASAPKPARQPSTRTRPRGTAALVAALREAESREAALREVVTVMSRSPSDAKPVFEAIAKSAHRLCGALQTGVFLYDGDLVHLAALENVDPAAAEVFRRIYPTPPSRAAATTRAILDRAMVAIPDVRHDPEYAHTAAADAAGMRSILAVPMLRGGKVAGVITVARQTPGPFANEQLLVLQTFADQAVIAI